jgi:hypothetical protein
MTTWHGRKEAAKALGVSERTVTRMVNRGELARCEDPDSEKNIYTLPDSNRGMLSDEPIGWVYIVWAKGTDYYKIGYTRSDIYERVRTLQTGCPHELSIELAIKAPREAEEILHEGFDEQCERGEWFEFERKFVATAIQLLNKRTDYLH